MRRWRIGEQSPAAQAGWVIGYVAFCSGVGVIVGSWLLGLILASPALITWGGKGVHGLLREALHARRSRPPDAP